MSLCIAPLGRECFRCGRLVTYLQTPSEDCPVDRLLTSEECHTMAEASREQGWIDTAEGWERSRDMAARREAEEVYQAARGRDDWRTQLRAAVGVFLVEATIALARTGAMVAILLAFGAPPWAAFAAVLLDAVMCNVVVRMPA